jgi:hypothetical protein
LKQDANGEKLTPHERKGLHAKLINTIARLVWLSKHSGLADADVDEDSNEFVEAELYANELLSHYLEHAGIHDLTKRMGRDLREAAKLMTPDEARYLVDAFYIIQEDRKRSDNQVRSLNENEEPNQVLTWFADLSRFSEGQIKNALHAYARNHKAGQWMLAQKGIGPVLAAGFLAHIKIEKAPTAGHIWRFAGMDPTVKWEKGQKRPWNAGLRVLCWKASRSFVRTSGEPGYYGQLYYERKEYEQEKNERGDYAQQATDALAAKNFGTDTQARKWYTGEWVHSRTLNPAFKNELKDAVDKAGVSGLEAKADKIIQGIHEKYAGRGADVIAAHIEKDEELKKLTQDIAGLTVQATAPVEAKYKALPLRPMLSPGHIDARCRRYVVKMFLAHLQEEWYEIHYGKPAPLPYPISHLGHVHKHTRPGK